MPSPEVCRSRAGAEALRCWQSSVRASPKSVESWSSLGASLAEHHRMDEAVAAHLKASKLPDGGKTAQAQRTMRLADGLEKLGEIDRAVKAYRRSLELDPASPAAYFMLGLALGRDQRIEEACDALEGAVALAPTDAQSFRALATGEMMRDRPSVAYDALRRALALRPSWDEAQFELGVALQSLQRPVEAVAAYRAVLRRSPAHFNSHANHGTALRDMGRAAESAASYTAALKINPGFPEMYNNLGLLLAHELHEPRRALRMFRAGRKLQPTGIDWEGGRGLALTQLERLAEAAAAYDAALASKLAIDEAPSGAVADAVASRRAMAEATCQLLLARGRIAHWRGYDELLHMSELFLLGNGCPRAWDPLYGLALPLRSPLLQQLAEAFAARKARTHFIEPKPPRGSARSASRPLLEPGAPLRVGYLSADYRHHVMAFLTQGMLEEHASPASGRAAGRAAGARRAGRSDFDVFALSLSADDGSGVQPHFAHAVNFDTNHTDRFVDLSAERDTKRASRIIERLGLHLLIDLNGYTTDERAELLLTRPAPVATHAVGFPGTMGAEAVPYILLDRAAVPPGARPALSERLVLMPHCYQVNDHARLLEFEEEGRATVRRPPARRPLLVNFNQLYKVSPTAGWLWCGALARLPGVGLWMLRQPEDGEAYLRPELAACGVAQARRLLFSPRINAIGKHLARTRHADLLVDTPEYNCHTTGSDALWSGVPALTVAGEQMASRVAASLVRAAGVLPTQVHGLRQYQDAAVQLMSARSRLRSGIRWSA